MVEGVTGLNIKDFPFAFSFAVLIFPNILLNSTNNFEIAGILLIGGMIGGLLTIINPGRLLLKYGYNKRYSDLVSSEILLHVSNFNNNLAEQIIKKNFVRSLSSSSISFEFDKIVGMFYFILILVFTIIRSITGEFTTIFNSNEYLIWGVRIGASIGLISVLMVLLHHVFGINFKLEKIRIWKFTLVKLQQPYLSQFDRICCVTVANLALDFANISNDIERWELSIIHSAVNNDFIEKLIIFNAETEKIPILKNMTTSLSDFEERFPLDEFKQIILKKVGAHVWNDKTSSKNLFDAYLIARGISIQHDVTFLESLKLFQELSLFKNEELYSFESQLRQTINSRDWESAHLITYRIINSIQSTLFAKKIISKYYDSTL